MSTITCFFMAIKWFKFCMLWVHKNISSDFFEYFSNSIWHLKFDIWQITCKEYFFYRFIIFDTVKWWPKKSLFIIVCNDMQTIFRWEQKIVSFFISLLLLSFGKYRFFSLSFSALFLVLLRLLLTMNSPATKKTGIQGQKLYIEIPSNL